MIERKENEMVNIELILLGIGVIGFFLSLTLAVVASNIGDLVKEIRYMRGDLQAFKNWELNIGDALIDKVAEKFTKKDGKKEKKSNGQRKLRNEIEHILMYNDVEWFVDQITDELMKVVERECKKARNEGYHDCELDRSGTIGCSMD